MPLALWCVLIAALLPMLSALPAKFDKGYDNANPRNPDFWREGFRARAASAQANGFEAFPFFAVAVIAGLWQGGDAEWIDRLAGLFIGLRLIYIFCYWTDRANLRSLSWGLAFASVIAIFTSPLWS
ncbi:MAPEG family protein [Stappia indica]|uniref:MAPEG family protein n=1 Tax=Stappia indica TaxID=538381 RepID=UPI001CD38568|nr:MAPEG family protein [Stappia indica]MCA1299903.1 MAPEG family protein [Stappia indica]